MNLKPLYAYIIYANLLNRAFAKLGRVLRDIVIRFFPAFYYKQNVHRYLKKIASGGIPRRALRSIPNIVLEASNTCNLNCSMCKTQESKRKKGQMPFELLEYILKIKREFRQMGLVIHTVGEPFMYSRFEDVLRVCHENGMYLWITTNGILLDKSMEAIKRYPAAIRTMAFSIDGATKSTYESIRRGASFEKLINNLEMIKDYRDRENPKLTLLLQGCLSKENFVEIPLFYKNFRRYFGIKNIEFAFLSNLSAEHESNVYYKDKRIDLSALYDRNFPCEMLWRQTHVLYDGRISACCRDYNGELIMGDIRENTILNIWREAPYVELRKKHLAGEVNDIPLCRDCYTVNEDKTFAFNSFLKYLFRKFPNKDKGGKFYMHEINEFLQQMASVKRKR